MRRYLACGREDEYRRQRVKGNIELDVKNCDICGKEHYGMVFNKLREDIRIGERVYSHWGVCPDRNEQVFRYYAEEEES